jgi:hypothetical protein
LLVGGSSRGRFTRSREIRMRVLVVLRLARFVWTIIAHLLN